MLNRTAARYRFTALTAVVIVVVLYISSCCPKFSLFSAASQPRSRFADQLAVFVSSDPGRKGLGLTVSSPPPFPAGVRVTDTATVFYIWCGVSQRPFEFRNYLSVRSAMRTLGPDNVWFYYESKPAIDNGLYNTWWMELIDELPFFHPRSLRDVVGDGLPTNACDDTGRPSVDFVYALVTCRGGTFVDESTLVLARPAYGGITVAVDDRNASDVARLRLMRADRGTPCSALSRQNGGLRWSPTDVPVVHCPSDSELVHANSVPCVHVTQPLYPKDIWTMSGDVGRLLRREFYGRPDVVRPSPSYERLAPNIGHVVWLGGGEMDFLFFLCVQSLLHVAKVDMVYIHGDRPPTGTYWDLLLSTRQKVQLVHRENAGQVSYAVYIFT